MLRSIREPLNEIPSLVNDTPTISPLLLSYLKRTPIPCPASLSHKSDQLRQWGIAALTASWIWYFTLSFPRKRSRFTFSFPLEKCRPYSLVRALHTATFRMASLRLQMLVFLIGMAAYDVLGVRYSHSLHVLTRDFSHQTVCQLGCVLVGKVQ